MNGVIDELGRVDDYAWAWNGKLQTIDLIAGEFTETAFVASGGSPQDVLPTGIVSGEALGTPVVAPDAITLLPGGIGSLEAFGAASVSAGPASVAPAGIASGEAFGTAVVTPGLVTVDLNDPQEDFVDTDGVDITAHTGPNGLTWTKHTSYPTPNAVIRTNRLRPTATNNSSLHYANTPANGADYDVVGSFNILSLADRSLPALCARIDASGDNYLFARLDTASGAHKIQAFKQISSAATSLGIFNTTFVTGPTPELRVRVRGNQFTVLYGGQVVLGPFTVNDAAVQSSPNWGVRTGQVTNVFTTTGIHHEDARLEEGVVSLEQFGTASVAIGAPPDQDVFPTGIASGEAFGTTVVSTPPQIVLPVAIASQEAHGTSTVTTGPVSIAPTGIPSAEAFGTDTVARDIPVAITKLAWPRNAAGAVMCSLEPYAATIGGLPLTASGRVAISTAGGYAWDGGLPRDNLRRLRVSIDAATVRHAGWPVTGHRGEVVVTQAAGQWREGMLRDAAGRLCVVID